MTNGVTQAAKVKDYISSLYDLDMRQVSQTAAGYSPVGMKDGKACASCNWMVPRDAGCILVFGDIMQTGMCNLHMDKIMAMDAMMNDTEMKLKDQGVPDASQSSKTGVSGGDQPKPAPNKPTGEAGTLKPTAATPEEQVLMKYKPSAIAPGLLEKAVTALKSVFGLSEAPGPQQPVRPLLLFKTDDGLRFFAVASNMYKDKHSEIIVKAAHEEYVQWVNSSDGVWPELRLWHIKESGYGKADWIDFTGDMLVASGLIYKGKEDIALKVASDDAGMSLGMLCLVTKDGLITKYRAFEMSSLPVDRAANMGTDFTVFGKEKEMAFTPEKRTWLKEKAGVPEEVIASWEASTDTLSEHLKALGLEYKEAAAENGVASQITSLMTATVDLAGAVKLVADKFKALEETVDAKLTEATRSLDDKVAEAFTARVDPTKPAFKASEATETKTKEEPPRDSTEANWFNQIIGAAVDAARG